MCAGGNIWRIWGRGGKRSGVDRTVGRLKGSTRSTAQWVPAAAPVLFGDQSSFLSKPTSGIPMTLRSESNTWQACVSAGEKGRSAVGGVRASLPALGTAQPGRAVACRSRGASSSLCIGSRAPKEAGRRHTERVLRLSPHLSCAVSSAPHLCYPMGEFLSPWS